MKINKCQCCLSFIIYNDENTDYISEQKIYFELIKETFNISISSEISKICNNCIKKLQEALEFKNMMLKSQEELKAICLVSDVETVQMNDDRNGENIKIDDGTVWEIGNQLVTSSAEPVETDELHQIKSAKESVNETKEESSKYQDKCPTLPHIPHNGGIKIKKEIREDSMQLLKYSNICLFKYLKSKFQCYTCKDTFVSINDLRTHTNTHNKNNTSSNFNLKDFSPKNVDISSLTCSLCEQACNDLDILREHLENRHGIYFWTKRHMFITYKLENGYQCLTCQKKFNAFLRLSTHMNTHSNCNVCEKCGLSFINRRNLITHRQTHKEKQCTICMERFDKSYARLKHMRTVHNAGSVKRYCLVCGKVFKNWYMLEEHRIEEHGARRQISKCFDCNKDFQSLQNLKVHIRSVHMKERNYLCYVCGMRFFTRADEKRHERRHDDVKSFSCSYCGGRFKSLYSLRRHSRWIHNIVSIE